MKHMKFASHLFRPLTLITLAVLGVLVYFAVTTNGFGLANVNLANVGGSNPPANGQQGTNGQNPSVGLVWVDALTQQPITSSALQVKDANTGVLLGAAPTYVQGQTVLVLANGSGYISQWQPAYQVVSGAQQIQGTIYNFKNVSITIGKSLAPGTNVGGTIGSTGNDSTFTTQANNQIVLTGNTFYSSGRLFIVWEISNTTNVASATLTQNGNVAPIQQVAVPNCYTNILSAGTPFRVAWEIPAVIGGTQLTYNLQTVAANGKTVSGLGYLSIYSEKDYYDTLTGAKLTSGICDSNNAFYNMGTTTGKAAAQINSWYYQ